MAASILVLPWLSFGFSSLGRTAELASLRGVACGILGSNRVTAQRSWGSASVSHISARLLDHGRAPSGVLPRCIVR